MNPRKKFRFPLPLISSGFKLCWRLRATAVTIALTASHSSHPGPIHESRNWTLRSAIENARETSFRISNRKPRETEADPKDWRTPCPSALYAANPKQAAEYHLRVFELHSPEASVHTPPSSPYPLSASRSSLPLDWWLSTSGRRAFSCPSSNPWRIRPRRNPGVRYAPLHTPPT